MCFVNCELGSLSYALEDLTGGYTERIKLRDWLDNPDFYWNKLKDCIVSVRLLQLFVYSLRGICWVCTHHKLNLIYRHRKMELLKEKPTRFLV